MPGSDLSELIAGKSEDLSVEYKAWMDTSQPEVGAKLARHIAALSNHGGGYLIFGVDDTTREPQGAKKLDSSLFSQEKLGSSERRCSEFAFELPSHIYVLRELFERLGVKPEGRIWRNVIRQFGHDLSDLLCEQQSHRKASNAVARIPVHFREG